MRVDGFQLDLTRVALRSNLAERGGAIFATGAARVTLTDSVIEQNSAFAGGGITLRGTESDLLVVTAGGGGDGDAERQSQIEAGPHHGMFGERHEQSSRQTGWEGPGQNRACVENRP